MRSKISLMLVGLFAGVFLLSGIAFGQSQGKVIELTYNNHQPVEYPMSKVTEAWGKEIEKRSNGRVKIVFFHGATLTSPTKTYDGVAKGLSDIGQSCFAYTPGRFPVMDVLDLPGYPQFSPHLSSRVANDIYQKFTPKELSNTHMLYLHSFTPGVYYFNKPVRTLDDLKGLKVRAAGMATKMIKALGGTPVGMPKADEYDALSRGVVNGTVGAPISLKGWRIADVCKYSTWVPRAGYENAMFVVMNKKKWESLPADIKKIFTEVSQEWIQKSGDGWLAADKEAVEYAKKMKHQFTMVDAKEAARWEAALKPLEDEYVKNAESKGLPGKAALEYRKQLFEKYGKEYPSPKLF